MLLKNSLFYFDLQNLKVQKSLNWGYICYGSNVQDNLKIDKLQIEYVSLTSKVGFYENVLDKH